MVGSLDPQLKCYPHQKVFFSIQGKAAHPPQSWFSGIASQNCPLSEIVLSICLLFIACLSPTEVQGPWDQRLGFSYSLLCPQHPELSLIDIGFSVIILHKQMSVISLSLSQLLIPYGICQSLSDPWYPLTVIFVCISTDVHTHIYTHSYIHTYTCAIIQACVYMYVLTHVCAYIHIQSYVSVCVCVYLCLTINRAGNIISTLQMWKLGLDRSLPYLVWSWLGISVHSHSYAQTWVCFSSSQVLKRNRERSSANSSVGSYSKIQTWRLASMLLQPGHLLTTSDQGPGIAWATHFLTCGMASLMTVHRCWEGHNHEVDFMRTMLVFPSKWKLSVMVPVSGSAPLLSVSLGLGEVKNCSRKTPIPKCDLRKPVSVAQHSSLLSVQQPLLAVGLWHSQQNVF